MFTTIESYARLQIFLKTKVLEISDKISYFADRLAKLAKSVIFYEKPKIFVKNGQKVDVNNLAENGRFYQILLKTCSLVS